MTTSSVVVDESFSFETSAATAALPSETNVDELFSCERKKDAQDIVSALQGSFDFLQDSEIDEDSK